MLVSFNAQYICELDVRCWSLQQQATTTICIFPFFCSFEHRYVLLTFLLLMILKVQVLLTCMGCTTWVCRLLLQYMRHIVLAMSCVVSKQFDVSCC